MNRRKPRLSIGMPVFNGEKYVRSAIESILAQTFQDFELIISDNASTDATQKICIEYVQKDKRVSYHRNKRNIGGPRNYNHLFELSSGEYFKWAAYDDILASEYLEKCVQVLDEDHSIVMCHSKVNRIEENGVLSGNYDEFTLLKTSSWKPYERFADMISPRNTCWAIHAVVRANSLARTPLHGDYIDADRNLLAEIALMGRVYEIPDHLFFRRDHPQAYTSKYYQKPTLVCDYRKQLIWWTGETGKRLFVFPHWKNCLEYFKSVNRVSLKLSERIFCYREICNWFLKKGGRQLMIWDLKNEFQCWRVRSNYKQNRSNFN